jgi:large-conductance mechanosensitive channel
MLRLAFEPGGWLSQGKYMMQNLLSTFITFEGHAQKFDPTVLLATGISLLVLGLIIWLAGTAFSRVISALMAAIVAFVAAITLTGGKISVTIMASTAALIAGAVLRRLVFAIAAAILVASCIFVAISEPSKSPMQASLSQANPEGPVISPAQSWQQTQTFAKDSYYNIISIGKKQSPKTYAVVGGAAILAFIVVIAMNNFGAALACSAMGTLMSLLGMIVLLFYKGGQPVEFISDRAIVMAGVFGGMICFGILIQLILLLPRKPKLVVAPQAPSKRLDEATPPPPKMEAISLKPK